MSIEELLERQDILADIAEVMYGETWVAEESFWGSPTELEMREIQDKLFLLGWEPEEPTDEQIAVCKIIIDEMKNKGRL